MSIETLQFTNAKIHHVSQTICKDKHIFLFEYQNCLFFKVIRAIIDIDHLILNAIKDQHFSIKIPRLTGDLEIQLIDQTIAVKFKQLHLDSVEIIDIKNVRKKFLFSFLYN